MKLYAFTDESGNSGLQLFDPDQPVFWSGTLIAFADADEKYKMFHKQMLDAAGVAELHGNKLGFSGIEKIANTLAFFIRQKKLHFSFVRVDKQFLAATKLFDLVFDSGNNPAMPPHAYGIRQLRLVNVMHFVQMLTMDDLKEFWEIFEKQDAPAFSLLLGRLAKVVPTLPFDSRTIQILREVLQWGSDHPAEVLDPYNEGHAPNFVAFSGLFGHLHDIHEETGDTFCKFVHDEQTQFVPSFAEAFGVLTKIKGKNDPISLISDITFVETFDCPLEVRSSSASFGLQIVDVCMWLVKRVVDRGDTPTGSCRTLFECLLEKSWIARFDFEDLVQKVDAGMRCLSQLPVTDEQMKRGKEILVEFEASRKARLLAAESK